MHRSRVCHFVIDVSDLDQGVSFWSEALDAVEEPLPEASSQVYRHLRLPDSEIRILLQKTDDKKISKERMHLDLETDDVEAEVKRLKALGATQWNHQQERGFDFWVMRDPWDNEFCVLQTEFPEPLSRREPWSTNSAATDTRTSSARDPEGRSYQFIKGGPFWALLLQIGLWILYFSPVGTTRFPAAGTERVIFTVLLAILVALNIAALAIAPYLNFSLPEIMLIAICAFSIVTLNFTAIYWGYGTSANFSTQLSHLDAVYFAIGTLTTAGTGNISAISELSRIIQATQMILDFSLVAFVLTIVISRFTSAMSKRVAK